MVGIYIHVPFCIKKCPYCDFYSVPFSQDLANGYVLAVLRNLERFRGRGILADTVYFGGGTPSLLSSQQLGSILNKIADIFSNNDDFYRNAEISLEANPCTIDYTRLKELREIAGFNRISIGVQSLCEDELRGLGRLHDRFQAATAIENAKSAGFNNISADIMLGVVSQNFNSLNRSIKELSLLPVTHISAYILKIEKGTAFDCREIYSKIPDEDTVSDLYLSAVEQLEGLGFLQYEVSNFAKTGYRCRHNMKYWQCENYIGIGPSAHSYFDGKRYGVPSNLDEFIISDFQTEIITEKSPEDLLEYAMLAIRLTDGINLNKLSKKYNISTEILLKKCIHLERNGLMHISDGNISLTSKGFLVSNEIIVQLFGKFSNF